MNNDRRKALEEATELLSQALEIIQAAKGEEEEAYEGLPESFQQGERGEAMQAAIDALQNAETGVEDAMSAIGEAVQ